MRQRVLGLAQVRVDDGLAGRREHVVVVVEGVDQAVDHVVAGDLVGGLEKEEGRLIKIAIFDLEGKLNCTDKRKH